jgi:hypothetical protein
MGFMDTGCCVPETAATLAVQQAQLVAGKRDVQMFPIGTAELPVPFGFQRHQSTRGIFHFRPDTISAEMIEARSSEGRENEFLMLGPHSKPDVARRICAGERSLTVTEYTPAGVELRSAAGTDKTVNAQLDYFERTKEAGNVIVVDDLASVIGKRLAG